LDLVLKTTALSKVREQFQAASAETDNVVLAGGVNLDTARRLDVRYRRRCLMLTHNTAVAEANMRYLETGIMYRSHGRHVREDSEARKHEFILDPMCVPEDLVATVNVINNNTTDHYPLLASVMIDMLPPSNKSIEQRNFKKVLTTALNRALETWPWSDIYWIKDPDAILAFINEGIVHGMDLATPIKRITVKALPLYLCPDTGTYGMQGLFRPWPQVQVHQEQSDRPGQARAQGAVQLGQVGRVQELSHRPLGDSQRSGRQAPAAAPRRGQGHGGQQHRGKPRGRKRGKRLLR
jgi:hypothetical protein